MEGPEAKPASTGDGGSDGDVGEDYACIGVDDYRPPKEEPESELVGGEAGDDYGSPEADDYGSSEEDTESKVIDVYHHPLKEEPEPELGDGDRDVVDVDGYCDYDPPKREPEPELPAMDDDADSGRDVGYDCSHCGISLSTREFKIEHQLRCTVYMKQKELESQVTKLYHCSYCSCPFINKELKEQHQRRYCRKRPIATKKDSNDLYFGCDKCKYVTKWKHILARHLLTHSKNKAKWFTCTKCSYKTVHKSDMTRHTKIHDNTYSCCCPICGKNFRTKQNLDDHLLRGHSDESDQVSKLISSKIYTCNVCDRFRTTSKTDFNTHLTVTHLKGVGRQKYQCSRCSYSTFTKGNLTRHSKTHGG